MSASEKQVVAITILGRDYPVKCSPSESLALTRAASYVDQHMRKLAASGKSMTMDQMAVIAALNIASELLAQKELGGDEVQDANQWIKRLAESIADEMETETPLAV